MSKVNDAMEEAVSKISSINIPPITLVNRVLIAYNANELIDNLKGIRSYPAVGVIYEGMHSQAERGETMKVGVSAELLISFVLIEQGDEMVRTDQKRSRSINYLDAIRDQFMNVRSTVTGHMWHFQVEAPAELKAGMICWVQRWSLPVQLPPKR